MTTLRERVLGGETTFGTWLSAGSPVVAEACARAGFDWVVIDTEHGMTTETTVLSQVYAIGTTAATPMVRIERSDRLRISRVLDMGAGGLVVPRVDSADDVRQALDWMRFPPQGQRGIALGGRGQGFGRVGHEDIGTLNDVVVGAFQIENPAAVADADAIAALPGADVLFVDRPTCRIRSGCPAASTTRSTSMRSAPSSPRASATARRPASCSTTGPSCRVTSSSGSGSSGSAPISGSWLPGPEGWSRPPAAVEPATTRGRAGTSIESDPYSSARRTAGAGA